MNVQGLPSWGVSNKLGIGIAALLVTLWLGSCSGQNQNKNNMKSLKNGEKFPYTNSLIHETSPYLLQHAHNPVDWYPWGKEAFEKAEKEHKLVLVSIGYAACHWCHVMEHESFEDTAVARIMNENFICIKVDREQRPDVDHQYMEAVQLLTGRGGWPLNCFTLPNGKPVWGGTYFPRNQWVSVLQQLSDLYKKDPQKMEEQAEMLSEGIRKNNLVQVPKEKTVFKEEEMKGALEAWEKHFDRKWGGNLGSPKFPMPSTYLFLMNQYFHTHESDLLSYVTLSLDKMAMGGIYDQIGGGFARYSTDSKWKVPHFEKMLYDNAQLLSVYAKVYQLTHKPLYKKVVYETLEFLKRDLQNSQGAFYASLDADSDGKEGAFYVWKKQELDELLGKEAPLFEEYYSVTPNGNWENGENILYVRQPLSLLAEKMGITKQEAEKQLNEDRKILLQARGKRVHPLTDTKILTSWNAMAITGLLDAYGAFDDTVFLNSALETAQYLVKNRMNEEGKLWRSRKNKTEYIPAFLDDYAFLASAFLHLYRFTFDEEWLHQAQKLTSYATHHFYNPSAGFFNYSELKKGSIIQPKYEITDNVIPSSNAEMASVLYKLGNYFDNNEYIHKAEMMASAVYPDVIKNLPFFSGWGLLVNRFIFPEREVVISGEEALEKNSVLSKTYLPYIVAGSQKPSDLPLLQDRFVKGKTLIYVCENKTCNLPVATVKQALEQMGITPLNTN